MKYRIVSNSCKYRVEWFDEENTEGYLWWERSEPKWKWLTLDWYSYKYMVDDTEIVNNANRPDMKYYLGNNQVDDIQDARALIKWIIEKKAEAKKIAEHEEWCAKQPWEVIEEK